MLQPLVSEPACCGVAVAEKAEEVRRLTADAARFKADSEKFEIYKTQSETGDSTDSPCRKHGLPVQHDGPNHLGSWVRVGGDSD